MVAYAAPDDQGESATDSELVDDVDQDSPEVGEGTVDADPEADADGTNEDETAPSGDNSSGLADGESGGVTTEGVISDDVIADDAADVNSPSDADALLSVNATVESDSSVSESVDADPSQAWAQGESQSTPSDAEELLSLQEVTDPDGNKVSVGYIPSQDFTGFPIEPKVTVENRGGELLVEGQDYTVSYSDNVNAGTAAAIITGMGEYQGTFRKAFKIDSVWFEKVAWGEIGSFSYTGKPITPKPELTLGNYKLQEGVDYVLSYDNNVDAGDAMVTARALGNNFRSLAWRDFTIDPVPISEATLAIDDQLYNDGFAITPDLTTATFNGKQLEWFSDYGISYMNNTNAGTATAIVQGRGNFTGTKNVTFKIGKRSIAKATIKGLSTYTYSGQAITPRIGVTVDGCYPLEGADYTVSFKNNRNAGKATVTITGKGGYTGTKTVYFTINKAENSLRGYYGTKDVSAKKVKKKAQVCGKVKATKANGKVTFTKKSGASCLKVNKKTGKITVKKGTKKGGYKIKVVVKAAGDNNHKAKSKLLSLKVHVR